jgi:hypothetical protein
MPWFFCDFISGDFLYADELMRTIVAKRDALGFKEVTVALNVMECI